MLRIIRELASYRELIVVLAWKNITLRYKQAYLGIAWGILKPVVLMLIFVLVRSFVGIESGDIPYPLLTYSALLPWIFFQESASEGVTSVVANASLIRKIYFPREIFPLTAVLTKLVELAINFLILIGLMAWYAYGFKASMVWLPGLIVLTMLVSLTIAFAGAAVNVYFRDISQMLPMVLALLMYASPVMYPLDLVRKKLLLEQAAGSWSDTLYTVYTLNPMAGIIDAFQKALLLGLDPDWRTVQPGLILIAVALPLSYWLFKQAEAYFADII